MVGNRKQCLPKVSGISRNTVAHIQSRRKSNRSYYNISLVACHLDATVLTIQYLLHSKSLFYHGK